MPVAELHKQQSITSFTAGLGMLADTAERIRGFLAAPGGARVVTIEMKKSIFSRPSSMDRIRPDARAVTTGKAPAWWIAN